MCRQNIQCTYQFDITIAERQGCKCFATKSVVCGQSKTNLRLDAHHISTPLILTPGVTAGSLGRYYWFEERISNCCCGNYADTHFGLPA